MIAIESFWRWESGIRREDDPFQQIDAHIECAKPALKGATMLLEPSLFDEDGEPPPVQ